MGIKRWFKKDGTVIEKGCVTEKETGKTKCYKREIHPNGTVTDKGKIVYGVDGQCNVVEEEVWESEPGTIEELEQDFGKKAVGKCKKTPADY